MEEVGVGVGRVRERPEKAGREEKNVAVRTEFVHKSTGFKAVGWAGQLKKWATVCGTPTQSGDVAIPTRA